MQISFAFNSGLGSTSYIFLLLYGPLFLLVQIDPSERLDSEVEDILVDLAEEFVESVSNLISHYSC